MGLQLPERWFKSGRALQMFTKELEKSSFLCYDVCVREKWHKIKKGIPSFDVLGTSPKKFWF